MARRSTPPMREAGEAYTAYDYRRGGSDGMRYSNTSLLNRLAKAVNNRQVGNLTPADLEEFFYGPKGLATTCARSTLGKYHGQLKAFLTWAHRRGWCDSPEYLLGNITHTSTKTRRVRLRLSEEQLWSMVEHAPTPRDAAMMVHAMFTGLRISEIRDHRLSDLNLSSGEVAARIIKTHEEDVMKVAPLHAHYLREWLTVYHDLCNPGPDDYLFPAANRPTFHAGKVATWRERGFAPGRRINNPGQAFRGMAEAANVTLESGDGWHTVRRSVARIFFDKASKHGHDAALRMTSAFLHHANTSTTEIYLGLELERVKRDRVMAAGFLDNPTGANVVRLDGYREAADNG